MMCGVAGCGAGVVNFILKIYVSNTFNQGVYL
jgi:hypothetical protein